MYELSLEVFIIRSYAIAAAREDLVMDG